MEDFKSIALFLTIVVPLVGMVAIAFFPRDRVTETRLFAAVAAAVTLALSVAIFIIYSNVLLTEGQGAANVQFDRSWVWLEAPLNITLTMGIDGISAPMILLTGIVFFAGVLVAWTVTPRSKDFFVLYFMLVAGVYGVFVVTDLFFLFFFYELAVLPMYLLIGVWGSSSDFGTFIRTKEYGALKLVLYLVAGKRVDLGGHPSPLLEDCRRLARNVAGLRSGRGQLLADRPELHVAAGGIPRKLPEPLLPLLCRRLWHSCGPLALPHLVARRSCGRAHGSEHGACWRADEVGGLRHHSCGDGGGP